LKLVYITSEFVKIYKCHEDICKSSSTAAVVDSTKSNVIATSGTDETHLLVCFFNTTVSDGATPACPNGRIAL
jgi:hypothetical protein